MCNSLALTREQVVGGGVVGLAIARRLAENRPDATTLLLERNSAVGTETSSRNSEVIHAGIYYGTSSLKTELCVRGKDMLYDLCSKHNVGHRRTGKWIVAQNDAQMGALEGIEKLSNEIGVPVRWVGQQELERDGEGVRAEAGVLDSPTTGIVDSHGLMMCLLGLFEEAGGVVAVNSPVQGVKPLGNKGSSGWELSVRDATTGEMSSITTETLINAAGLGSVDIHNLIVPESEHKQLFYAKGNYFSYSASNPSVTRLIYPAPEPGAGGLGTHLTLDLGGRVRFGPDVEWVNSPEDLAVNADRMQLAISEIKKYLPGVDTSALVPDYAGIRPKLQSRGSVTAGKGFQDFIIRNEPGYQGWVNLLGIESPGLTSSLAIAEKVEKLMHG